MKYVCPYGWDLSSTIETFVIIYCKHLTRRLNGMGSHIILQVYVRITGCENTAHTRHNFICNLPTMLFQNQIYFCPVK
jgi:hypothetical protein